MKNDNPTPEKLGTVGIWASYACAIHCMLMPFVGGLLPFIGLGFLTNHWVEIGFIFFSIAIGSISLIYSYFRIHKQTKPLVIFFIGMAVLISAQLIFNHKVVIEVPIVVLGAILIAVAHLINRKLSREFIVCTSHAP
jgi:hypothetical protein